MSDPRPEILKAATADRVWDVVVIGGGASGLATALEAATRGASPVRSQSGAVHLE